jgi:hypothetical protein
MIAPALRKLATTALSSGATRFRFAATPLVVWPRLDINVELYRDWDTVQRTDGRVVLQRSVCLLCFPQGVVCHHMHNGIQMRIDLGDTI